TPPGRILHPIWAAPIRYLPVPGQTWRNVRKSARSTPQRRQRLPGQRAKSTPSWRWRAWRPSAGTPPAWTGTTARAPGWGCSPGTRPMPWPPEPEAILRR
ncbi:HTH-type transcriptional regulator immR, partial [Dysosmobacter welbionis]